MSRLYSLNELDEVSPEVAWKLIGTLFLQTRSLVIGAASFTLLGLVGFIGTGSIWYLCGSAAVASICGVRIWLTHIYTISRDSASPLTWALRSLWGAWLSAACWGVWSSLAILYEPDRTLVVMVVGTQSATLIGAAVRACAVRVVAEGQIYLTLVPFFVACLASRNPYLAVYCLPIGMHLVGALALTRFLHNQTLQLLLRNEEKSELVAGLELARQELEAVNSHLEGLVLTDALTGIANRRAFDFAATREWRRALRENTTIALLFLDVDHFKSYNDFYGHQAGDLCLQEVAATIGSVLRRPGDLLARYGGEEFAVVLPQTGLKGAIEVGEAIVKGFTQRAIPHDTATSYGHVSVSIGAAAMAATPQNAVADLTSLADSALYSAKRGGRNRVCGAEATPRGDPKGLAAQSGGTDPAVRAELPV